MPCAAAFVKRRQSVFFPTATLSQNCGRIFGVTSLRELMSPSLYLCSAVLRDQETHVIKKNRTKQRNALVLRYIILIFDFSGLQVPMFLPVFFNDVLPLEDTSFWCMTLPSNILCAAVVPMPLAVLYFRSWPPVFCLQDTAMWRKHILE